MKKILLGILVTVISLGLITFSYAMVFNGFLTDHGINQKVIVPSGKTIVFSLSKQIDSIDFSKDSGFTIRTLEGGEWIDMSDNISDYTPMRGYMIRNISDGNLEITMHLKNITDVNDTIFQKTLKAGWNLVGPAYKDDEQKMVNVLNSFGNSHFSHIADFTNEGFFNIQSINTISGEVKSFNNGKTFFEIGASKKDNGINIDSSVKNLKIKNKNELANVIFLEGLAYAVFVSNDTAHLLKTFQKYLIIFSYIERKTTLQADTKKHLQMRCFFDDFS
ncbi:MAG: hypothetical protein Q9M94_03160 [Candidatus Gracilibacteria bacterium]|nr:hypothetical protein [Candidatus Gracilibacteria bacterium]